MSNEEIIWESLIKEGFTPFGAAGLMGNIVAESNCKPENLQNIGNSKLGLSDAEFTQALNTGKYTKDKFVNDGYGYGLCQWTYNGRKKFFYDFMKNNFNSFDNLRGQIDFMIWELKVQFPACYNVLKNATSIKDAAEYILKHYEMPADQSDAMVLRRTAYGGAIYDKMVPATKDDIKAAKDQLISILSQALELAKEL